jgi:DNA repair exonuclease SbcCD ATPase subunit
MTRPRPTLAMTLERNAQRSTERLDAYRSQIERRIEALRAEFEHLKGELAWINDRTELLARLADDRHAAHGTIVLQGADLREQTVIVLATRAGGDRPMHYKDWYDETLRAGFAILGRRPTATFLTAATRSPLVVRTDEPGFYRFDPDARRRLADEADKLRAELHTVDAHVEQQQQLSPVMRKHRTGLLASLRRVERQLAEADRILDAYRAAQQTSAAG